jgi:[ribosomal protein S18]-alanine N-acetyltransferase
MLIQPMVASDVVAVERIELLFFSPWTKVQIFAEIERKAGISLIARDESSTVVGWCCGIAMPPDAELLKIAVAADRQRQGVAALLLQEFITLLVGKEVEQIFLEVRSANTPALRLYQQSGWEKRGKRKNYYKNPVDDAVLLVRSLKH